jgi:UDP-glucose 4-epimerase
MKTVLVVGGAGYIGSHMVKMLAMNNFNPVVLDNYSTGFADAVRYGQAVEGSMADRKLLDRLFSEQTIDAVMHFASFSQVGESVTKPDDYYRNNFSHTLTLLDAMVAHNVKPFIFSSTAAIFGNPLSDRIDESHPKMAINPYGRSKWMVEQALGDYDAAFGLKSIALRYFNAAGADSEGELGERHDPETHLIPLVLQAALGERAAITVFGNDYDTTDGTCIRDYIHIEDLCSAHMLALNALLDGADSNVYNLGNGNGFSVSEVIQAVEEQLGWSVPTEIGARRAGDPAILVADASKARRELGWQPRHTDLRQIIQHAADWELHKQSLKRARTSGSKLATI